MGVTVAGNLTTASASLLKPRAAVALVSPVASAAVSVPVSAIAYIDLVVGVAMDTTGRYRFLSDAAAVVDTTSFSVSKALTDTFGAQSSARFSLARPVADAFTTQDELARHVSKALADAYGVQEDLVFDLAKRVFDSAGVTEDSTYALSKLLKDGVGMNDLFDVGDGSTYAFVKSVLNVVFANEQLARSVSKKLQDSVAALSLPQLHVQKAPFVDGVAAADYAQHTPELFKYDAAATSDTQTLNVTKLVTDLFAVAEVVSLAVAKAPFTDGVGIQDTPSKAPTKGLSDAVATADAETYDLSKLLADSVGFTDTVTTVLIFIRSFSDSFSTSDTDVWALAKASQDSFAALDAQTRALAKSLADGVGISDFTGIGDGVAFVLTRTVANVAFIADNSVRQALLGKSEQASTSDSGSLVNQGYCDLTYFAEDYVGATRSF